MNAFEPLIWTTIVFFVIKMVQSKNPKYWLHIGVLMGIGLEMKHTIVLYGVALLIGFLFSDKRKLLYNSWILWGGLACFLLILPNLVWQYSNHFPSLELYSNSFSSKNIEKSYFQVIIEQVVFTNPVNFLLWISGLLFLLTQWGKQYRLFLVAFVFLLFVMVAGHSSRPDRIASIYTILVAVGAVGLETTLKPKLKIITLGGLYIIVLAGGIMLTPAFIPIFQPHTLKPYLNGLGLHFDIEEGKKGEPIPQWLADRIGWPELVSDVAQVFYALPENEKHNAVIISTNYGEAGALELYGSGFGLPPVYATHNSFHSWGPPSDSVRTYIGVMIDIDDVKPRFDSVEVAKVFHCQDCTKPQQKIPIYILRGPKFSIEKAWPEFKNFH